MAYLLFQGSGKGYDRIKSILKQEDIFLISYFPYTCLSFKQAVTVNTEK